LPYEASFAPDASLPAAELLTRLATVVRQGLDVPLSEIFPPPARSELEPAADAGPRHSMEQV
jgi:hypothetical protein